MSLAAGIVAGVAIGWINFWILRKMVSSFVRDPQKGSGALLGLKMIPLLAVAALLILVLKVNAIAFVAGFALVLAGFCWKGLSSPSPRTLSPKGEGK